MARTIGKFAGISAVAILLGIAIVPTPARAQFTLLPSDFFQLERPGHAEASLYAGGFGSDKYGTAQEGVQVEQSITRYVALFGRVTGYQLWVGSGFSSPLNPHAGSFSRLNFGRFQAGVDFAPFQNTHLFVSYGHDVADSDAHVFEVDFSSWLLVRTLHPINFSTSTVQDFQNSVTSSEIDLQAVVLTRENYLVLAGGGGAIYGGGFVTSVEGQAGPDLTFYYKPWAIGFSAQAGYGDAHQYGQVSVFKQFGWTE